jgi:hypothetical protein
MLWISHDQLASVEYGRTPLRIGLALAMATATGCNLKWLADGDGPTFGPLPKPDLTANIPSGHLFSRVWEMQLKGSFGITSGEQGNASVAGDVSAAADVQDYLVEEVSGVLSFLPPELHQNFFSHVTQAGRDFVGMNMFRIIELNAHVQNQPKKDLTISSLKSKSIGVKSEIEKLIEKVKRKASKPGAKAALARALGIAPARISEYLSGKKVPGGEYTLRLQHWVEQQERQK